MKKCRMLNYKNVFINDIPLRYMKRGSANGQLQLNLYQFHFLQHVSTLVKSHHQAIKTQKGK
jgi:hypothetical protein